MAEDTAASALLSLWQGKDLANSHSFTSFYPRCPQMLTGQLSTSAGPPLSAGWGRLLKDHPQPVGRSSPSLRRVRVPRVGSLLGTSNSLLPDLKRRMCLLSHHWSFSCSSWEWSPKPAFSLGVGEALCGLSYSLQAPWRWVSWQGKGVRDVQCSIKEISGFTWAKFIKLLLLLKTWVLYKQVSEIQVWLTCWVKQV